MGREISCSDLSGSFVDYMTQTGLNAQRLDATQLDQETDQRFDNIMAQGLSPLSQKATPEICEKTIKAIHQALKPNGRLIVIFGIKRDAYNKKLYYQPDEQLEIITDTGLFKAIKVIPHQVTPPGMYRQWNAKVLNWADFWLAKIMSNRKVLVFENWMHSLT